MTRRWERLRVPVGEPLREALLPFLVARVVVVGALGLAHFIVDRTHPASAATAARVHSGLLGWDAGWYESIARVGYHPLGVQSLRFFPAVPLLARLVGWVPGVGDGPALVLIANAAALAATALLFLLVRRETGQVDVARRSLWIISLLPSAFVLVMGYAESTLLALSIGCFLALRPAVVVAVATTTTTTVGGTGAEAGAEPELQARPRFALAGLLGLVAALTRPIGVLLALAIAVEVVRWWSRSGARERAVGVLATAAPVIGVLAFLTWSRQAVGDFWAPLRVQLESSHHGGLSDPAVTLYHDAKGVLHHHVGTALHVPWVLLALALLIVCWRRLPASYTVFTAAVMAVAVAGTNLDSFERYALSAFPLSIAAALVCRDARVERGVLALLSAGLAGYAVLAFLNISVP